MKRLCLVAGFLVAVPALSPPAHAQDVAAGKLVYDTTCRLCHEIIEGKNRVGPSLFNVFGRRAGAIVGFTYSDVLKASGITWNDSTLDKWLDNPQSSVPGTRMTFAGVKDAKKRRDLIAFLKSLHN